MPHDGMFDTEATYLERLELLMSDEESLCPLTRSPTIRSRSLNSGAGSKILNRYLFSQRLHSPLFGAHNTQTMPTSPDQNQIDGIVSDVVDFVVADRDNLSAHSAVAHFLTQRKEHVAQREAARNRHQDLVESKQKYDPLDRKVSEFRQSSNKAENDLTKLHEPLGRAVFGAVSSGEIPNQAYFSERADLKQRIDDLQSQLDELAAAVHEGVRRKLAAKGKQAIAFGKLKLEERKLHAADTNIGREIITSNLDESVRCDDTAHLLDRVAHCRDDISTCAHQLQQAETARNNCRQDLCEKLSLGRIEDSRTLDEEMKFCCRTEEEANVAMQQIGFSLVKSLSLVDQTTLPATLVSLLERWNSITQQDLVAVSHSKDPDKPRGSIFDSLWTPAGNFPRGSLILVCWKCYAETLIADHCAGCGSSNWGTTGAWAGCESCKQGYDKAQCSECGHSNSPTNIRHYVTKSEKSDFIVVLCFGVAAMAAMAVVVVLAFD